MAYQTKKVDDHIERLLLTGLIVSTEFLQGIQPIYKPEFVAIPFVKTVAGWCWTYFKEYETAPGRHIQDIFNSERRHSLEEEQADIIESFLEDISNEFERSDKFNVPYLLDQVEKRFKARHMQMLNEDVAALLAKGDVQGAERILTALELVERPSSAGIDPILDQDAIRKAFEQVEGDALFVMPGALGKYIGNIERDTFISILAPEKRGKTFTMMEFAMRALRQRCNVAFFSVGDMSEAQFVRRIHQYISRRSLKTEGPIKIPVLDCTKNQDDSCEKMERVCDHGIMGRTKDGLKVKAFEECPDYKPCSACQRDKDSAFVGAVWYQIIENTRLEWHDAIPAAQRFMKSAKGRRLKLATYPNNSINISGIRSHLDMWEKEGFVADVVIIDYADILAPEESAKRMDYRHQINETWKAMRALSQERHVFLLTATQADSASYDTRQLRETNFSEDKRKYSHVTMILTLNQAPEEKKAGIMRVGKMFVREDDFDPRSYVTVLEAKQIGRPYIASF